MPETRKLAAILCSDVVGYSRLAGADEDRILARLRALRSDLIDPTIAVHHGRVVKRTGDGAIVEFRSVVDAVNCAVEIQNAMAERNAGVPEDRRIVFRVGIHVGDVVEESDGDLMGDGVNVAARLEGIAKPGAICLSEQAYWQVRGRLSLAVSDLGSAQLKNIAEPVHVYSLEVGLPAPAKPAVRSQPTAPAAKPPPFWRSRLAATLAIVIVGLAAGTYAWRSGLAPRMLGLSVAEDKLAAAPRLSIVALPFSNLSGDPDQDYFAEGVTENLTTELSRIRGAFVIARNTAMTYKGKAVDAKEIGKDLGVRYVLEGSVQRDQNRVRVNAQLIDAETGAHLWADRFEENLADLFKLQDEIVVRLASALRTELYVAETEKAEKSKNPDAIDFVMRGFKLTEPPYTQEKLIEARSWFEKAIGIDPSNSDAHVGNAWTYNGEFWFGWKNPEVDYDTKILGEADRAISLDRNNVGAYLVKGSYLQGTPRLDDALRVLDAGLAIDPNNPGLLSSRASTENYLRQFDKAKSDIQLAMRLSPRDPFLSHWHNLLADAELGLGQVDAALEDANKAVDGGYRMMFPYLNLAAGYALKGDIEKAKPALAEARRLNPKLSVKWINERKPILQPAIEALRKAGLPEE
jgi:adenylate cyclase